LKGNGEWDSKVLQTLAGWVDLHSIHLYTTLGQDKVPSVQGLEYENNVFGPAVSLSISARHRADVQAAERNIEICKSLIDLAQINRVNFGLPARPIKIAFDEWNVWDELKGHAKNGLAQVYDYSDMLGFVAWLNVLVRKHDDLGLACLAQSVNVVSLVLI
jgi:alpha-N-arabinofuranosidase